MEGKVTISIKDYEQLKKDRKSFQKEKEKFREEKSKFESGLIRVLRKESLIFFPLTEYVYLDRKSFDMYLKELQHEKESNSNDNENPCKNMTIREFLKYRKANS